MSDRTYCIRWRSKRTGYEGQGNRTYSHSDVVELVEYMNQRYPDIEHWAEEATSATTTQENVGTISRPIDE